MITRGPDFLRQMANKLFDALLQGAEAEARKAPFSIEMLRQLVEAMKSAPDYDHYYRASYDSLMKVVEEDARRGARVNAFGRLLVHPLDPLFSEERLDRRLIGNYFFFVRSLFGDEVELMADEAATIAEEIRGQAGGNLDWASFYADPRVKRLYFRVIARVIRAFRIFETRRDWVMKVMQHDPTAVGLSSNVYIERPFEGQALPFGNREFFLFFDGLVRPLAQLSPADAELYRSATGEDPARTVGGFLAELEQYRPPT
ncbi:MAG: hypothetical protein OJJ21_06225 [Ferrovibrio sp.]|uniref:hypothetical protein n=1 Tax=Ferrovibrio sp. TaxID=1917215 RepID=UPI0026141AA6|nr:hypothetical protein [Ferrovibrio sp.]MCW0233178.1 hypothetical protein [Ferrovibrio sp.]